ncbi:MAG TPA: HD family hydrolase, partial [Pyrinomonadaceae bacterium]|nr:HD family hydrolase [Pyrinomonadaceae bacterium]
MIAGLIELQRLKRLERTGWLLRGMPAGTESVAAHSFGVSITAMLLADELAYRGVAIDVCRVLRIALMHDWAEARVGDMPRTATKYFGTKERKNAERAAFGDIVVGMGNGDRYRELFLEYEERQTVEARLVKAADIIDLLIEVLALERAGARGLDEFWDVASVSDFQLEGVANELIADTIKSLLEERRHVIAC